MDFPIFLEKNPELAIRLSFIDFKLYYTGVLSRSDIIDEFNVSEITASRIISEYKNIRENNFNYSNSEKKFFLNESQFVPFIDITAEEALSMLSKGFNKNLISKRKGFIEYEKIGVNTHPICNKKVAVITRAIYQNLMVSCVYNSAAGRRLDERELAPLVILFDGINWIFRAKQPVTNDNIKYKNFNFSRIVKVTESSNKIGREHSLDYDVLWNTTVPIEIVIKNELDENTKENIRRDYGMEDKENKILMTEKAAFVWIILNQWRIRYSGNKETLGDNYLLELNNEDMLRKYNAIP